MADVPDAPPDAAAAAAAAARALAGDRERTRAPAGDASDTPLDGVIGVGPDGTYRVGGLTSGGGSTFTPLPAQLTSTSTLSALIDPTAKAGAATCGMLAPGPTPYLFCSFRAYDDDAAGKPVGNLIFLVALDSAKLAQLSKIVGMPLSLVAEAHAGKQSRLSGSLGSIGVTTATLGSDKIVLDAAVPTVTGAKVLLEFSRGRPIHAVATSWSEKSLAVIGILLLIVVLGTKGGIHGVFAHFRKRAA